jgi:hypothetical protein
MVRSATIVFTYIHTDRDGYNSLVLVCVYVCWFLDINLTTVVKSHDENYSYISYEIFLLT